MFEAFKIGIKLSLANEVSAGLLLLTGQFGKLDQHLIGTRAHLSAIELQMKRLKTMGMVGGALAGAGMLGLAALKGPIEAAKDYETAYTRFKTLNLGDLVNQQAHKFARGTQAFGASSKDLMETLRESVGMFGGMENALKIAPKLAELNAANSFLFGANAKKLDEHAIKSIMRFNDMRGLTDSPEDFLLGLNLTQRMYTGSGGMIRFQDLELMAKRGGAAFKGMSDEGIMMMASMLQENGGNATGTAIMSLYQNLVAGRTTKKTMAALMDAGLVKLGEVNTGTVGGKKSTSTVITSIVDEKMLRENPGLWLMTYAAKAAKDHGAKTDSEIVSYVNKLLSNRTGSNMGALFTTQQLQALRDQTLVRNAMGVDQTIDAGKRTTVGREAELRARYNSLQTELGLTILPVVNKALEGLIALCKTLIGFAREFPVMTKALVSAFGVLSALSVAGGAIMIAKAAFGALGLALGGGGAATAAGGLAGAAGVALTGITALAGGIAALAAGFAVGSALNVGIDALITKLRGKDATLGTSIYDLVHSDDGKAWAEVGTKNRRGGFGRNGPSPYVPGGGGAQMLQVDSTINLDGKVIGKAVSTYQAKEMGRPATGPRTADGRQSLRAFDISTGG